MQLKHQPKREHNAHTASSKCTAASVVVRAATSSKKIALSSALEASALAASTAQHAVPRKMSLGRRQHKQQKLI